MKMQHLPAAMLCQKFSALLDPLRVGIDRPDGVQRCTRYADQILADSDALFPYNIKPITAQQVIDLGDRTCGRIFNRHYPEINLPSMKGGEHILDLRIGRSLTPLTKKVEQGLLGERARDPKISESALEQMWLFPLDRRLAVRNLLVLAGAAQFHHLIHKLPYLRHIGRVFQTVRSFPEDLLLPACMEHRQIVLFFVCGNLPDDLHPLLKKRYQLVVNLVDLLAVITQICHRTISLSHKHIASDFSQKWGFAALPEYRDWCASVFAERRERRSKQYPLPARSGSYMARPTAAAIGRISSISCL